MRTKSGALTKKITNSPAKNCGRYGGGTYAEKL